MKERRLFQRFKVNFPVNFSELQSNKQGDGNMIDISAGGGGMIVTHLNLSPETFLQLHLEIPDKLEPLHVKAKVVWTAQVGADAYRIGVQFENVDFIGLSRALKFKTS